MWIEPVRDWNLFKAHLRNQTDWGCELNLWGIETQFLTQKKVKFKVCELNLWGIETADLILSFKQIEPCELNLWGIETEII